MEAEIGEVREYTPALKRGGFSGGRDGGEAAQLWHRERKLLSERC